VFGIVSCQSFECTDLLAEEEVRSDDAEEESDGGGRRPGSHSDMGLDGWVIYVRRWV